MSAAMRMTSTTTSMAVSEGGKAPPSCVEYAAGLARMSRRWVEHWVTRHANFERSPLALGDADIGSWSPASRSASPQKLN